MAALSLKKAILDEQAQGVNPEIVKNQLLIISKLKRSITQKHIEDFLHGKAVSKLTMQEVKICQELAVFRMNNNLRIFPYNLHIDKRQIYPFY